MAANSLCLKTLILGGGTNLLVSDEGFDGLAIRLTMDAIEIDRSQARVRVGASIPTNRLVEATLEAGLTGLEFAAGLPGTVGGAVAGNAGCFGHTLSEFLVGAMIVEQNGALDEITNLDRFGFQYRCCRLVQSGAVLTDVIFGLETGDPASSQKEAEKCLAVRVEKHPTRETHTAGSYFKNLPPDEPGGLRRAAGALLDQAGVHGLSVGDAAVFERHANIIVNRGRAAARDVLTLAAEMKRRVLEQFGVELEEEVRFVGRRPENL